MNTLATTFNLSASLDKETTYRVPVDRHPPYRIGAYIDAASGEFRREPPAPIRVRPAVAKSKAPDPYVAPTFAPLKADPRLVGPVQIKADRLAMIARIARRLE